MDVLAKIASLGGALLIALPIGLLLIGSLLAAGLTAHAVAALLGHTDTGLVLRRYGHALPDELAAAGERLGAWRAARQG